MAYEFRNTSLAFYPGGRPYNNKDFRVLQQLVLDTTSFFNAFGSVGVPNNPGEFIISGCSNLGEEGFVWLGSYNIDPDLNDRKLRYVAPHTGSPLTYPCYIGETNTSQTRTYKDGQVKNVFIISEAYWSQTIPGSGSYITITDALNFSDTKLETTFGSIGASYWSTIGINGSINFNGGATANVGIGTSGEAAAKLEVVASNATILARNTSSTDYSSIRIYNDQNSNIRSFEIGYSGSAYATSVVTGGVTGESAYMSTTGAYPIQFATNNTMRMLLDSTGRLGIGVGVPTQKLDVRGSVRIGDGSSTQQETFYNNLQGTWQVGANNSGNGTSNDQFYFYDTTYRLTIQRGTGNIGIGTASPSYKIDVQGTMHATGAATFDAGINVTGTAAITGAITGTSGLTLSSGNISVSSGNISVSSGTITASSNITSGGTVSGSLLTGGTLQIGGTGQFGAGVTLTTGNLTLSSGNITISGTGTGSDWIATSDAILKENISGIDNALDIAMSLRGHKYNLKNNNKKLHYGFIAQEMEEIVPELVEIVDPITKLKGVNYDKVSAILVEAIKEQQQIINNLTDRLQKLESKNI